MDLDTYLTTNILISFVETLGIRNPLVDVIVVTVGVVVAGVITLGLE